MKFPYGICDFRKIITEGYFYCDRTDRIPLLEKGRYLLFLRPRRFGKSLLLSMLANYYDVAKKDEFEKLFGHLKIGKNPSPHRNGYFILEWDFSCVDPSGSAENIKRALHDHVNSCIRGFALYYETLLQKEIDIDRENALNSMYNLLAAVRMTPHPIYLLIDEYDNFANEVMMGVRREENIYEALIYEEGPLKTLFKAIKSSTKASVFDRIFITGVSPVVMSDITSGFNIGENVYLNAVFNDLCGFHEAEIDDAIARITGECGLDRHFGRDAIDLMRTYYNGYTFSPDAGDAVYNPTSAVYFMKAYHESCKFPRKMLDANLAADDAKLRYISQMPDGNQLLLDLSKENYHWIVNDIEDRFGIQQMLSDQSKDNLFRVSFLYYFGVLTIKGETSRGKIELKVPNLAIRGLYIKRIHEMLLPKPADRDDGLYAADQLCEKGDMGPLCEFIETRYFKVFHNRDYRWANELTVKTAFLTLLHNDILYIMDSEPEIGRGHADLTMIIRPDMRNFEILDVLIEFKFVGLKDAGLTGETVKNLPPEKLKNLPIMKSNMKEARAQAHKYGDALELKYKNLRLRRYAVVSLGFEKLWWEEIRGADKIGSAVV